MDTDIIDNTDTITLQDGAMPIAPPPVETNWLGMAPMVLIFVVFYFLLIRPQEKRRRAQETLISGVKKGEEVMTNSGLFGTVTSINDSDNTIMVRVAKDVELKMLKSAVADITSRNTQIEKKIKLRKKRNNIKLPCK